MTYSYDHSESSVGADETVAESLEETRMMVASIDSIGSYTNELRAFAADMVCQFEFTMSMDVTETEAWRAYPAAEQEKIKNAMKKNRNTVNLGDRIIDLQSMTWSNSWTARQNVGRVRVKAINNYAGKEAAVSAIQKAWQERCGLGNISYALRRRNTSFSKTVFYRELTQDLLSIDHACCYRVLCLAQCSHSLTRTSSSWQ
jgi:hypothetical protein